MFKDVEMAEPYKSRYDKVKKVWQDAAENSKLTLDPTEQDDLERCTFELIAMSLDLNYDLTAEQLGDLIDPLDQVMITSILLAMTGVSLDVLKEGSPEPEKKNSLIGSTEP